MIPPASLATPHPPRPRAWCWNRALRALFGLGLVGFVAAWIGLGRRLVNVVNYELTDHSAPYTVGTVLPPLIVALLLALATVRRRAEPFRLTLAAAPLGLAACGVLAHVGPPRGFLFACAVILFAGWMAAESGLGSAPRRWVHGIDRFAPALLGAGIASATLWHAGVQLNFFQHFSLGYADFGFFVTELEYCLPWKDVPDRFADTRMGYHCIPFFYVLAPFYALFRSPVLLMVVGPLALNLASVPFYQLVRHRGASPAAALLIAASWLALPSVSRLPYANTYGFQSIYLAVPWLAFAWSFGLRGRWRASHLCLAAAMLCEETVCGVAFGWGLYVLLFTPRRGTGAFIAAAALAYLGLCTTVVIPHFAGSSAYTRLELFGDLTPSSAIERFFRPRVSLYLLALFTPLLLGLSRSRAALAALVIAAPTLPLILLVQNDDYLNLKYWHQSSVLPALFLAAVIGICKGSKEKSRNVEKSKSRNEKAAALGLFVTVLLFHQLMGFSPLAQAYRPYIVDPAMQSPDPRMQVIALVRVRYARETTTVLATERMAAHFCDYHAVLPGSGPFFSGARPLGPISAFGSLTSQTPISADLVIIDRSDTWDPVIRERGGTWLIEQALAAGYKQVGDFGSVAILAHSQP